MTETTTDQVAQPVTGRRWWPRLSVQARITVAVGLLVALALASAGALVYALVVGNLEERLISEGDQEIAEFLELQRDGFDPDTGRSFTEIEPLLRVYLQRNVPADNELLVGAWDGRIQVVSASERGDVIRDPAFVAGVERLSETGGTARVATARGEMVLDALVLEDDDRTGAFVVAFFIDDERDAITRLIRTYAVAAVVALAVVTLVAAWQAGRLLRPLRDLRVTAQEISETDLSRRIPVAGNDDLTDLARTVNAMLARLEQAFQGQRQFLDDAGHELRTPLTILQGHLELLDAADVDEVERTRDLLLDEVDRMSRLVDELILLTKADRPEFVKPAEVDLAVLTRSVLDKISVLGERTWTLDGCAHGIAVLDVQRMTQALVQLAQNAVKYTGPGDTIGLGSRRLGGGPDGPSLVRFWVRDHGPGVPLADRERIFDRFVQSDRPAGAAPEGFGLGLSIVQAIVTAHGGRAWVEASEPATGRGALFVLEFPLAPRPVSARALHLAAPGTEAAPHPPREPDLPLAHVASDAPTRKDP